jgi:uroporphyrinogen III methyltransferase/synthase
MNTPGIVYLVGAGPGDPGLLTLRGRDCLAVADVVVYDYLANPELLAHAPETARRIYVGKQAGQHTLTQEQINALLVEQGLAGQRVVRLKGGDPFVFGRGGEEALALQAAGIPVEVVPGVTAGIAAPAYAGIPVTHRTLTSVVTFATGHEDPEKDEPAIDWAALAVGGGTLVFYMGVGNLPGIVTRLTQNGRRPDTPVALIGQGTLPVQRVVEGTLATIVARVEAAGLKPPAIIIVGEVVSLRRELQWFERKPLFGRTVVVTRSRTQASDLAAGLRALGARVLLFPTIRIAAPADPGPLQDALRAIAAFNWILFTSVNAVDYVFAALAAAGHDSRALAGVLVGACGSETAERLRTHGIRPDLVPPRFTSESLFEALRAREDWAGKRVLLPRADIAPPALPDKLRQAGAEVTEVTAYRTVPDRPEPAAFQAFRDGAVDVVTFSSSSTARNFAALLRNELGALPENVLYASIGPETSRTARAEGITIGLEARESTVPGLLAALTANLKSNTP